jgi:hypothetical protein
MCCGQKRSTLRGTSASPAMIPPPSPSRTSAGHSPVTARQTQGPAPYTPVNLRYLQNRAIRVQGAGTGRQYDFSAARPVQPVDRRDLPGLLRTGLFTQS